MGTSPTAALGLALRLGAAAIWLVAGAAKLTELQHFHAQVNQYRLLPGVLEAPFAYALPFVELFVGLYLLLGLLTRVAALAGCFLMVLFLIAEAQAWARGLSLDCGCFGGLAQQRVGPWTIVRDSRSGSPRSRSRCGRRGRSRSTVRCSGFPTASSSRRGRAGGPPPRRILRLLGGFS
jgi:uncharacterized membrane protein YphA (DoxX/SURF4 family)